jgi:hypothetical protein
MRDVLLRLADEARKSATSAHDTFLAESLKLGPDGGLALAALDLAAARFGLLAAQLERLAAEFTTST